MTAKRFNGSSFQDLTIAKRWNGSAFVDLTIAKRWDGVNWIDIPLPGGGGGTPLSVTAAPGYAFGEINVPNPPYPSAVSVASNAVTVSQSGGSGTATISWTRISGSAAPQISSTTSFTVSFDATLTRNNSASAVWRGTVTKGAETAFVDIPVDLAYTVGGV